jgi:hypothetical protein
MRRSTLRRWSATFMIGLPVVLTLVAAAWSLGATGSPAAGAGVQSLSRSDAREAVSAGALPSVRAPAAAAATWCGTATRLDLTPNAVAGFPVHWIYAIPSDAPDRLAAVASAMQTDAEAIDAWWRREDPTRVLRNDLTQLSCGLQIDLTTVRMQLASNQLATQEGRFSSIFNELFAADFRSSFTKYLVYFDGAVSNNDICGQGGSDSSGFGLAVVYVQACPGVSTAAIAAHELLHTFGSVPRGAPHDCPEPNDAHTCDNTSDLMHPFIDEGPLETKLLDPGRDDYYGHGAGFSDSQDSPWLVQLDRQVPLAVSIAGSGSVASDVPGLQCGQSCTTTWNNSTRLSLSAVPQSGSKLVRWSGACRGAGSCNVTVAQGATVSALFAPLVYRLRVGVSGRGTVRSSRAGITCRPRCSAAFPSHVPLRLAATPAKGWRFRSWSGACRGRNRSCTVPMTAPASARAIFVRA